MRAKPTVALVSYPILPAQEPDRLTKTLSRMASFVTQAAGLNSDLVAFPEICNHLGSADSWQFEPLDGPTIHAMAQKAREHHLYVVCPLATLEHGVRYNSSVLLGREGNIVGVYHKNFPTHGELDIGIRPGTETPVFETDFGRVGLSICFDLNYWEVGSGLCVNEAELVIWSSMWPGARMLTKWAIEFGFSIGAVCSGQSTFVDIVGRELVTLHRDRCEAIRAAPIVVAPLSLDRRLLHHDYNIARLKALTDRYGSTAAYCEWLPHECLVVFDSQLPDRSSDQLIEEFGLETMRDYLARARRDRELALRGEYPARAHDDKA